MEEGVVPLSTILASDYFMDLDYMDELLLEGCWLEANASDFNSSTPSFDPWPLLETESNTYNAIDSTIEHQSENNRRWWIGPKAATPVMDRLIQALGYIKDCSRDKDVLIQVWVPVTEKGKRVLTTSNQPFSLDLNCCPRLAHYREISVNYQFPAEENCTEGIGLPGRVFASKVPEWTPDVRLFTRDEYPRVRHAQQVDVRGTLAVPILEQGSHECLGVIEVVLTKQKIQYRPELETVCKALEAVDLLSAKASSSQNVKARDLSYQAALPEIVNVLRSACASHGLPLAQTWVPCVLQGKGGCRHSEENLQNCISPIDSACYVGDSRIQGFHEACSDYHLLKDQGIVGKAFRSNQPCFSPDVTAYSRSEYPLSHYARMFGLKAAVAIRLRSICTGSSDFVLELFLPMDCVAPDEQKKMLTSLSTVIQSVCRTLRVVTDEELQEESGLANSKRMGVLVESSEVRTGQRDSNSKEDSMSGDGGLIYTNKVGEKRRVKSDKIITLQVLRQHFAGSLKDAARKLGVCPTTLKRICRQHGVQRWPSRKIKKVGHSLQKIQRVIDSVQGASGALQIDSFYSNFPELASPRTTAKSSDDRKHVLVNPVAGSPSSSCSQSSGSSQCCSSVADPTVMGGSEAGTLKRARTDVNLLTLNDERKLLPRLKSHVSLSWPNKSRDDHYHCTVGRNSDAPLRIKVTYGEDNIRFRMKNEWRYEDLVNEIARRFGVDNPSRFHLKYLDDDAEWVLLTCDADVEECMDVCQSSRSNTIKLLFLPRFSG